MKLEGSPIFRCPFAVNTNWRATENGYPPHQNTPFGGWVTLAMAGFLACGSMLVLCLPSFPVAQVSIYSPHTVAGAAKDSAVCLTLFHIASR